MKVYSRSGKAVWRRAFTLIELMVVITIIVILAALTVTISGWVQRKAAVDKARTQLKLMESQLQAYERDVGSFPAGEDLKGLILYQVLYGDGVGPDGIPGNADDGALDGKPDEGATIYIPDFDPETDSLGMIDTVNGEAPEELLDPFGFTWRYRRGDEAAARNPDFDLWSPGPDGEDDTEDDIVNW